MDPAVHTSEAGVADITSNDKPPSYEQLDTSQINRYEAYPPAYAPGYEPGYPPQPSSPQQAYPQQEPYPQRHPYPPQQSYSAQQPPRFVSHPLQQSPQQQQSSVTVVNAGQPQMFGSAQPVVHQSYCGIITLACCVFWFCGCICGGIAFILASMYSNSIFMSIEKIYIILLRIPIAI